MTSPSLCGYWNSAVHTATRREINDFTTRFRQYSVLATRRNQVSGHLVNCERTEKQCLAKHTSKYHDAQNQPDDDQGTAPSLTAATDALRTLPICRKRIIFLTPPTQSRIHAIQFTLQTNEIDNSEKIFIFRTIIQDLKEGGKDKRYNKQFAQSKRFYVEKN